MPTDFYYEKVIQPGQAGNVKIKLNTAESKGLIEHTFMLETTDPKTKLIKFTVKANVVPLPAFVFQNK